jgi:nitric oxide reductase subunit C
LKIAVSFFIDITLSKSIIFFTLFLAFIVYSLIVYTYGTKLNLRVANDNATKGKLLFQQYNCIACHQVYGLGGYLGADLTTIISATGKGESYAKAFLKNGTDRMPDFKLSEVEIQYLIEYLKDIDQSASTYKNRTLNYL